MERKRVVIIGGGCAGLSAAYTLNVNGQWDFPVGGHVISSWVVT